MSDELKLACAVLSVFISGIAFIPYYIDTWKINSVDDPRPTVSGFVCWILGDVVILAAMIADNAISWQMVPYVIGASCLVVLCLRKSLKIAVLRGEPGHLRDAFVDWSRRDTFCIALVLAAVVIWGIKHDPDYAIYLTAFSSSVGTVAIVIPLLEDPRRESLLAWTMFLVGGLLGVIAIPAWSVTGAVAPIYFAATQLMMVVLCARRYKQKFAAA